jgi:hypothetical protein
VRPADVEHDQDTIAAQGQPPRNPRLFIFALAKHVHRLTDRAENHLTLFHASGNNSDL